MWGSVDLGSLALRFSNSRRCEKSPPGLGAVDGVRAGESAGRCGRVHQPANAGPFADAQAWPLATRQGAKTGGTPDALGNAAGEIESPAPSAVFRPSGRGGPLRAQSVQPKPVFFSSLVEARCSCAGDRTT